IVCDTSHRQSERLRRPPTPTVFPYTTLFRSALRLQGQDDVLGDGQLADDAFDLAVLGAERETVTHGVRGAALLERRPAEREPPRSEEHTSELQSRENLVCRLLLEKKNHADRI